MEIMSVVDQPIGESLLVSLRSCRCICPFRFPWSVSFKVVYNIRYMHKKWYRFPKPQTLKNNLQGLRISSSSIFDLRSSFFFFFSLLTTLVYSLFVSFRYMPDYLLLFFYTSFRLIIAMFVILYIVGKFRLFGNYVHI